MTSANQTAYDENVQAIVSFYESGIKESASQLGIELEHTLVRQDGSAVSYSEPHGVEWLLGQLADVYPDKTYDSEGDLLGVSREGEAVTIEPAAQVELSAGPFTSLHDAEVCFQAFELQLQRILGPEGIQVAATGYHPSAKAADLELIPKQRYDFMNAYLGATSPYGVCMMRGSTSTQVSIDYTSAEDCLRKLRIAFALVPVLSLLCDNSPTFEGAPRTHQMVRTKIWQRCDPDRCGVVPHVMDPSFTWEDYARYVLDTPAILAPDEGGAYRFDTRTFGEIYASEPMSRADVEHALSMFFTDVRLKTYIEIRPADALPIPHVISYAALIKGLFYAPESLDALEELFSGVTADDIEAAKDSLMEKGYDGSVYGHPAGQVIDRLFALAHAGLAEDEQHYLKPLESLAAARTTLAYLFEGK